MLRVVVGLLKTSLPLKWSIIYLFKEALRKILKKKLGLRDIANFCYELRHEN